MVVRVPGFAPWALILAVGFGSVLCERAAADTVWMRNGDKVVGKIVQKEAKRVQIEIRQGKSMGRYWIDRSEIFEIHYGLTPEEEFEKRLSELAKNDLEGHEALLLWAKKNRLRKRARALEKRLPQVRMARLKLDHPKTWCRGCDATGREKCVKCVGSGQTLTPCVRCQGTGATPCKTCGRRESTLLRCRRCSGSGEYERFDPKKARKVRVKCADCKGVGTHACPSCDGKREQACPGCKGEKGSKVVCMTCKGTPTKTCTTCGGSRQQPTPVDDATLEQERLAAEKAKVEAAKKKAEEDARKEEDAKKEQEGAGSKG